VLIDELRCEDQKKRINAVRSLPTISIALGTERTRNELLAYILELLDDEEEVLMALTETLGGMLDYCGGPAHSEHLFRILEKLFAIEEHSVREKVSLGSFIFYRQSKA
jgi:serine/threonine-protein phosphatase 2A regulatory subunit A